MLVDLRVGRAVGVLRLHVGLRERRIPVRPRRPSLVKFRLRDVVPFVKRPAFLLLGVPFHGRLLERLQALANLLVRRVTQQLHAQDADACAANRAAVLVRVTEAARVRIVHGTKVGNGFLHRLAQARVLGAGDVSGLERLDHPA